MASYSFSSLVFVGDSLTDQGGLFDLTSQVVDLPIPPASAGYDNKFTNGDVYAEYMADIIGISDVDNYALGSARALGSRTVEEVLDDAGLLAYLKANPDQGVLNTDVSLSAQLDRFQAAGPVAPGTAAVVNIGSNDYGNFEPSNIFFAIFEAQALADDVVDANIAAAETLLDAGVDTVIINLLPVADFFPAFQQLSDIEKSIGEAILERNNDGLRDGAADLVAGGADVRIIDMEFISNQVQLDQTTFGLIAPLTEPKLLTSGGALNVVDGEIVIPENAAVAGFDDDQIAFWDQVHPSTALHGVLGAFQAASLGPGQVILGTKSANTYVTGNKADFVMSGNSADVINTRKGFDTVFAGRGSDDVQGRNGNDLLSGGSGHDKIQGQKGSDVLAGGIGDDELRGGALNDVLIDGRGDDVANGGSGDDIFIYVEGSLIGGSTGGDFDVLSGASGNDTLYLVLSDATRAIVEAELTDASFQNLSDAVNIDINSIENIILLDSREDLSDIDAGARIEEADIWGLI